MVFDVLCENTCDDRVHVAGEQPRERQRGLLFFTSGLGIIIECRDREAF